MQCVVIRPFDGPDGRLQVNQLIDSTDWRNERYLLEQRYLRVATDAELASVVEVEVQEPEPSVAQKPKKAPKPPLRIRKSKDTR